MKKILFIVGIFLISTISVFSQSKREWENVQSRNSINIYEQFINIYPNGKYTELAKQKLAQLKARNERKEQFAKLVQQNINNIRIGIAYSQIDSMLKLRESGYDHPFRFEYNTNTNGPSSSMEEYLIVDYLYLKFINNILNSFAIIK